MRINYVSVVIYALLLALFKIFVIPTTLQQITKVFFIILVLCFLVKRINIKEIFNISILCGVVIISSSFLAYFGGLINIDSVFDSVLHSICIYCTYTLIFYCSKYGYMNMFINNLYKILCFYCIMSILTIIIIGSDTVELLYYFAGNKFRTGYYFILLAATYLLKYYDKIKSRYLYKIKYIFLCLFVCFVSYIIKCSTAVVGGMLLIILFILSDKIMGILKKASIVSVSLVIVTIVLSSLKAILEIPYISYFIEKVLGESLGLTGRFVIYEKLHFVIESRKIFGHGYGNYAVGNVVGFGNAQNGMLQILVDYGLIGYIGFIVFVAYCFYKSPKINKNYINGAYIFVYIMIFCSIIEISFNYLFYICLFLIRWGVITNYQVSKKSIKGRDANDKSRKEKVRY